MPVDFMTKWKGRKQTDTAVAYITNAKNQITSSAEASALEAPTTKIDAIPYIWNRDATTMAIKMEPFVLIELDTRALHKPLGLLADTDLWPTAQTARLHPLYAEYTDNLDEPQYDIIAFREGAAELAQLTADRDDPFTRNIIADGAITMYLGTGAATLYLVNQAILSIELKEARRISALPVSGSAAMDTDAPGWGHYEGMSAKDYDDVADDWKRYSKTINDRKRRAEQHDRTARADDDDDDNDPYGDPSEKSARPDCPIFEVSALEANTAFMELRSGKRKYQPPLSVDAPMPAPVVPAQIGLPQPSAHTVLVVPAQPGPPPDTAHVDPKHVAVRLDDNGLPGPSSAHSAYYRDRFRTNFQTNREGIRMSDEDEDPEPCPEPSCFEDPEFFYDSDARYEDQ
jgi:hypothetical protein